MFFALNEIEVLYFLESKGMLEIICKLWHNRGKTATPLIYQFFVARWWLCQQAAIVKKSCFSYWILN